MNSLHAQQQWELMHERQAEMLKEAQREHLASIAQTQSGGWLSNLLRRPAQSPTNTHTSGAITPNVAPELG